jgi:hypothetical protein
MSLHCSFMIEGNAVYACVCICDVGICALLGYYAAFSGNSGYAVG